MKRFLFSSAMAVTAFIHADQVTVIEAEDSRIRERMASKGFTCRENPQAGSGQKLETSIDMTNKSVYYIAVITGRGGNTARTASLSLVNQRKHIKKPEFQNTTFGTELSMRPNSNGVKTLKFELTKKSDYRVTVCIAQATLRQFGDGMPNVQEFGNF